MKIIDIKDKDSLKNAAEVLKSGGILVFPTDTVYGIGCLLNDVAIKKLYKIKNRPLSQPTAILLSSKPYHILRSSTICNMGKFLSGEMTIVINKDKIDLEIPKVLIKDGKVGIRIPNHKWLQKLIDKVGPIVASSANQKGESAPKSFDEISNEILEDADLVIKTDEKLKGIPSRVIDLEENKVLR